MTELLLASTVLIGIVLLIRGLLGGWMSMRLRYGLWGLVLLRLLIPVWLPGRPVSLVHTLTPPVWERSKPAEQPVQPDLTTGNTVPVFAPEGISSPQSDQTAVPVFRSDTLRTIWYAGICCVGGYLLLSNVLFYRRVHRNAVLLEWGRVPVYQTEDPAAPCLTGLLHPRIYLPQTLPQQRDALDYILAHEQCHLRHRDNWWALLRGICLAVWWFHPLVWLAAVYARRDCELACDEAVLARLGQEARIPYGETLVSLAARQRGGLLYAATGLTTGGRAMRERLNQILHGKRRLWATALALLLALLAAACTFTEAPEDSPKETAQPVQIKGDGGAPTVPEGRRGGVYTFLLAGVSGGGQTDTLLLATYDTAGQTLNMMSIPRDTMVDIPYDIKRINGVYTLSGGGAQGQAALRREVGRLVGFDPDYMIEMDWNAVGAVVDAVGGVPFEVPVEMDYDDPVQDLYIHIPKGYQVLDGAQAMGVIRYRRGNDNRGYVNGDLGRIETQQAFLQALAGQILSAPTMTKLTTLVETVQTRVTTDLSRENLLWFAKTAVFDGVPELRFFTLPCTPYLGWSETYQCNQSYLQPQKEELLELVNRYFNPYQTERTAEDLELLRRTET